MIRFYVPKDYSYIYQALKSEGLKREEMTFELDNTFMFDSGFLSYRITGKYPLITHFYIDKDKRSLRAARTMLKLFRQSIMRAGHLFYILEVPNNKRYMEVLVRYLKGKKYNEANNSSYYYVPVFGRINKI